MIAALAQTLARRSQRERWLLAILLGLVVPLAFMFLVALPLLDQRTASRAALANAQATQAWFVARQHELAALPVAGTAPTETVNPPVGLGGIEDSLIDAGLRGAVTLLANVQGNNVSLTLDAVLYEDLMGWIDDVEAEGGYSLSELRLERGAESGFVDVDLRLEPQS